MAKKWPTFETKDLVDTPDDAELMRRWKKYDREMKALIATGTVYQDDDGWWHDKATGELIGPDPEIERPGTDEELAQAKPLREAHPDLYEGIQRARGRPPVENRKQQVSLRLSPDVLAKLKASGKGWQSRVDEILRKAVGL
ncbi:BrnA antitoxin family protein [Mesorhizobium sp. RMAD-H1]|uniref:BrnA antitoxin family protein n=1 Tax=Mesorhizobium sp. RMAD-H1 TaxID=2587065 RepID=UPI001610995D|nr:BrnA antitoxin family protein [Mesorhizobium sp. RMAD-H1]MBB2973979.1 uncharacterized protein (DUF4415 family) [Mesorhizobium sp. RMAD-H1]